MSSAFSVSLLLDRHDESVIVPAQKDQILQELLGQSGRLCMSAQPCILKAWPNDRRSFRCIVSNAFCESNILVLVFDRKQCATHMIGLTMATLLPQKKRIRKPHCKPPFCLSTLQDVAQSDQKAGLEHCVPPCLCETPRHMPHSVLAKSNHSMRNDPRYLRSSSTYLFVKRKFNLI